MAFDLICESRTPVQIGTTVGWNDFTRWVDLLDGDYPELRILCVEGWTDRPHEVASQVDAAMADDPADESVIDTAANLAVTLESLGENEIAYVGDEDDGPGGAGPDLSVVNPDESEAADAA